MPLAMGGELGQVASYTLGSAQTVSGVQFDDGRVVQTSFFGNLPSGEALGE